MTKFLKNGKDLSMGSDISSVNGKIAGTFFGDDFTVTSRRSILGAKWSQGLPVFGTDSTITGAGARWYIIDDPASSYLDGASRFTPGTTSTGKCFISTKQHNRYEPGHLSYFGYTSSWDTSNANGDYILLIGAVQRGAKSLVLDGSIKEGILWGFVRESGIEKKVCRIYKNFEYIQHDISNGKEFDFDELNIFEQQLGYYGIHPSVIYGADTVGKRTREVDYKDFHQSLTHVQDPNLAIGVYCENNGNTGDIGIVNGSVEFGNYSVQDNQIDGSAREISDCVKISSIAVDSDYTDGSGFVAAYKVNDNFQSISELNSTGVLYAFFQNRIENQLLQINAQGDASVAVNLNIVMVPEEDVTATFTQLRPYVNVLQRADSAAVDFTNQQLLLSITVTGGGGFLTGGYGSNAQSLADLRPKLRPGMVAVLCLDSVSSTTLTDFRVDLITKDLF